MSKLQHVDPLSLNSLKERIQYTKSFLGFTSSDAAALHASKPVVATLVSTIVDEVYVKLLSYDITAKAFVPRQSGFEGNTPASLNELDLEHPQIKFRKDFLKGYLVKLVTMDYEQDSTWEYLDKVAIMHTGAAGFAHRAKRPSLRVEYIHMGLLLGYVVDILLKSVVEHPDLDAATKSAVLRAFNKIVWIQNDLFARQYTVDQEAPAKASSPFCKGISHFTIIAAAGVAVGAVGIVLGRYLNI
ncbi:hypothetical protein RUND412_003292 [Rhizina undulata]